MNVGGMDVADVDAGMVENLFGDTGAGVGEVGNFSGLTNFGFGGPIGTIGLPFAFGKAGGICVAHPGRKMVRTNVMQRHRKNFNVIKPPFFDRRQSKQECSTCISLGAELNVGVSMLGLRREDSCSIKTNISAVPVGQKKLVSIHFHKPQATWMRNTPTIKSRGEKIV